MTEAFYFGCVGDTGHYLWNTSLRRSDADYALKRQLGASLDCDFAPGVRRDAPDKNHPSGFLRIPNDQPEGLARLTHRNGWTVLSFWDRSVDRRGSSHSTFLLRGTLDFDAAVAAARAAFPSVWKRYAFEVREAVTAQAGAR